MTGGLCLLFIRRYTETSKKTPDPSVHKWFLTGIASEQSGWVRILIVLYCKWAGMLSRYSDWLRAERRRVRSMSPDRFKNVPFSTSSTPALGSTQPPIQWVRGVKRPGSLREAHLQLVQRSRKYGSIHPLQHTSSWRCAYLVTHRDNFTVIQ
jgi:hypothetical protein